MRMARKTKGIIVNAYQLGSPNSVLDRLIENGKIRDLGDGIYEVFSQEAVNGTGERARAGDYIKIDSTGSPYPNDQDYFMKNHRHIEGNIYEQVPNPVFIWQYRDDMCPEIEFLIERKGLTINQEDDNKYFNCMLWGSYLSSPKNSFIVFYSIQKDFQGNILDIDFNFVENSEFFRTYEVVNPRKK